MMDKDLPADNIYTYALSKTLSKVSSPLTVGLYSSCHSRINMILRNIEVQMKEETGRQEQRYRGCSKPRSDKPSFANLILLIIRLVFYRPVWTEENQDRKNVRFVFVRFSAWHFTGSDLLWAGMVMHLCQALQKCFGELQLGLYRMIQYREEEDAERKTIEDSNYDWRSRKICCIPLWAITLVLFVLPLFILVPFIIFSLSRSKEEEGEELGGEDDGGFGVFEAFAIATFGIPAVGTLKFCFLLVKNLIFSMDNNIKSRLNNQKVSEQLGFMSEVRKEMRMLSCFIHFLEVFERRKIRVVLEISNLDRCTPEKIVGVLDAINILLSDEESPFISLLAIDPEVLVQQVDNSESCFSKKDRAYSFLDRIVTLPFIVPTLCDASRRKVFWNIVQGQSEILEDFPLDGQEALKGSKASLTIEDDLSKNRQIKEELPLFTMKQKCKISSYEMNEENAEQLIQSAFESLVLKDILYNYISADTTSMRRVINSIQMSIIIMGALNIEPPPVEKIAAWVLLVDSWPCRLSWTLQCLEDDQQRVEIDGDPHGTLDNDKTLWQVFCEHRVELHMIGEEVEKFLEQDGDPELFERFLKIDFKFTVREAEKFKLHTVNLDYSIRNEMARIRGTNRLKGTGRNVFNSLPARDVFSMSPEDVCSELSRLGLPEKYFEIVRKNDLTGRALLLSDHTELRQVLQMTLGEWTTFKIHFFGVTSPPPPSSPSTRRTCPSVLHNKCLNHTLQKMR